MKEFLSLDQDERSSFFFVQFRFEQIEFDGEFLDRLFVNAAVVQLFDGLFGNGRGVRFVPLNRMRDFRWTRRAKESIDVFRQFHTDFVQTGEKEEGEVLVDRLVERFDRLARLTFVLFVFVEENDVHRTIEIIQAVERRAKALQRHIVLPIRLFELRFQRFELVVVRPRLFHPPADLFLLPLETGAQTSNIVLEKMIVARRRRRRRRLTSNGRREEMRFGVRRRFVSRQRNRRRA